MSEAKALLRLQELDIEYSKLKNKAENLPQKEKANTLRSNAKKVASELTKIVGEKKDIEMDLSELEVHKKYVEDKVTEVQATNCANHRESIELERSLSTLAKKLEKIDFETNQLLERLEKVETAEKNAREVAKRLAVEEQNVISSYKSDLAAIAKQVENVTKERTETIAQISQENLNLYVAARKRFGAIAVETIIGNKPSFCHVALQKRSYAEIRRAKSDITTCPYCKRILVIPDDAIEEPEDE